MAIWVSALTDECTIPAIGLAGAVEHNGCGRMFDQLLRHIRRAIDAAHGQPLVAAERLELDHDIVMLDDAGAATHLEREIPAFISRYFSG